MKLTDKLFNKHGENLDEKSLTICSGTDYININYQHIVCPDAATAKVIHPLNPLYYYTILHKYLHHCYLWISSTLLVNISKGIIGTL